MPKIFNTDKTHSGVLKGKDGKAYVLTFDGELQNLGEEQFLALGVAQSLTVPVGTTVALFNITDQPVRMRTTGTAATALLGLKLPAETLLWFNGPLADVSFFEAIAGAEVNVEYYGPASTG